jgi:hypothetical protein
MVRLTVHRFVLWSVDAGVRLAQAVVCPEVEYAGVLWTATNRLEHRPCTPNLWHSFKQEAAQGMRPGPIPQVSAVSILLVGARLPAVHIEYVGDQTVVAPRSNPRAALDVCLRADV